MTEEIPDEPPVYVVPVDDVPSYFTVYDPVTGKINRVGGCRTGDLLLQVREGEALLPEAADGMTQYVLGDVITSRPTFTFDREAIVADGIDEAILDDLPDPVSVTVDGVLYEVTGGSLKITSIMKATYVVEIDHFPWMPFKAEIIAT